MSWGLLSRGRATNLLLALASVAFSLACAEVFLRTFNPIGQRLMGDQIVLPRNTTVSFTNEAKRQGRRHDRVPPQCARLPGPDPPRDFDRWLTVVAVGGSTTECLYLSEGRSWPEAFAAELEASLDALWVNNAGLDGHSTYGHSMLMEQMLDDLRPKVILFLIGINDVGRAARKGSEHAQQQPFQVRLARHSALAATVVNLFRYAEAKRAALTHGQVSLRHMPTVEPDAEQKAVLEAMHRETYLAGYRERVRALIRSSRAGGAMPVLMTQAALYGPGSDPKTGVDLARVLVQDDSRMGGRNVDGGLAWRILELYNDVVRDEARALDVPLVDVARTLPKDGRYFYDFLHLTNAGAAAVGRIAADALCPVIAHRFPEHRRGACPTPAAFGEEEQRADDDS